MVPLQEKPKDKKVRPEKMEALSVLSHAFLESSIKKGSKAQEPKRGNGKNRRIQGTISSVYLSTHAHAQESQIPPKPRDGSSEWRLPSSPDEAKRRGTQEAKSSQRSSTEITDRRELTRSPKNRAEQHSSKKPKNLLRLGNSLRAKGAGLEAKTDRQRRLRLEERERERRGGRFWKVGIVD